MKTVKDLVGYALVGAGACLFVGGASVGWAAILVGTRLSQRAGRLIW